MIGADSLGFLPVECLDKLADHSACGFCKGCFTGVYPVEPPKEAAKNKFEKRLSETENEEEDSL